MEVYHGQNRFINIITNNMGTIVVILFNDRRELI